MAIILPPRNLQLWRNRLVRCCLPALASFAVPTILVTASCKPISTKHEPRIQVAEPSFEDGTYRGIFADRDKIEVNLQFTLKDGIVTKASFRHLAYGGQDILNGSSEMERILRKQYQEVLDHLIGKDLQANLADLYRPGAIVTTGSDGMTGATIRSNKVISAIRDGLNRGVYSY